MAARVWTQQMATVSRAYAQMSGKEIFAKKVSILNNKERRGGGVWRETNKEKTGNSMNFCQEI